MFREFVIRAGIVSFSFFILNSKNALYDKSRTNESGPAKTQKLVRSLHYNGILLINVQ